MDQGRFKRGIAGVLLLLTAVSSTPASGAPPLGSGLIYSCTDANGKRLTSDRPIPECTNRDQRELNADGSVRRIVPPPPTADERAEKEARDREALAERVSRQMRSGAIAIC